MNTTIKLLTPFAVGMYWLAIAQQSSANPEPLDKTGYEFIDFAGNATQPSDTDTELQKLLKARVRVAVSEWQLRNADFKVGRGTLDVLLDSGRPVLEARLALVDSLADHLTIRKQYVVVARETEKLQQSRFADGALKRQDLESAKYVRLDAEIGVLRLGGTLPKDDKPLGPVVAPKEPDRSEAKPEPAVPVKPPEFVMAKPFVIDAAEPELQRLIKERANCALIEARLRCVEFLVGRGVFDVTIAAFRHARDCRAELTPDQNERLNMFKQFSAVLHEYRESRAGMWGCMFWHSQLQFQYEMFTAELDVERLQELIQARGKAPASPVPFPRPDVTPQSVDGLGQGPDKAPDFVLAKHYEIDLDEPALRRLPKQRMNFAIAEVRERFREYRTGRGGLDELIDSSRPARDARLDVLSDASQRLEVVTQHLDFLREIEKLNQARFDAGALKQQDLEYSRYERMTAEIHLKSAKGK